jgi:hypothetical protein
VCRDDRAGEALDRVAVADLARLLDEVEGFIRRYVVLTPAEAAVVVLWIAHAHTIDATATTPYLHITSAEAESGKTRLLEVLGLLVPRALETAASVTVAVMYRAIEKRHPTLLIDEADRVFKDRVAKAELLGVVNAGWRRGTKVYRIGGPQHDRLDEFETFCPKAIAGLDRGLDPTLASRCLRIEMRRRRVDEPCEDLFFDEVLAQAEAISASLAGWADQAVGELAAARPERLGVRDRLEEGIRLLLAIAESAGDEWAAKSRRALLEVAGTSSSNAETTRVQLLRDVQAVFGDRDELKTTGLLTRLFAIEESPWAAWWADGRPDEEPQPSRSAAMKLANMLKPFGVKSRDVGDRDDRRKGYRRADFADAFARYLPPEVAQVSQTAQPSEKSAVEGRAHEEAVRDLGDGANPHEKEMCATYATSVADGGSSEGREPIRCEICQHPGGEHSCSNTVACNGRARQPLGMSAQASDATLANSQGAHRDFPANEQLQLFHSPRKEKDDFGCGCASSSSGGGEASADERSPRRRAIERKATPRRLRH